MPLAKYPTILEVEDESLLTFKTEAVTRPVSQLDEVDGIGEVRARTIKQSLRRMQEQFVFDNEIL